MTAFTVLVSLTMGVATDAFTDNERLYLTMLIQERDGWARELQRKIGLCESELKGRKRRPAKSGYAEPVRIPLGDGRWFDLDDKVSRKDIEQVIKYLNEKLELVENGTTIPTDRFWDPRIFSKFGRLGGSIRVVQVIGPSDMIVDRGGDQDRTLWIEGFSTKNYADDQTIGFGDQLFRDQLFLAVGTKSYTNTLGARATTRLLRPFVIDREKVIAEFRVQSKGGAPPVSNIHPTSERRATDVGSRTDSDAVVRKRIPTASGELTEDEQRYLTAIIKERDERVDELRQAIAQLNLEPTTAASPKKKRGTRTTKSERLRAADQPKYVHVGGSEFVTPLKSVQAELTDLESGKRVIEPHVSREGLSKVGSVMQIQRLKVVQVFGPSDMLATGDSGSLNDQISWLNGFPTKDMADGQVFSLNELIVIDGTKRYETVTGTSRTVFMWRPLVIDREKVLAQYRARSKPAPEATVPAKALPKLKPDATSADPEAAAQQRFGGLLTNSRNLIKAGIQSTAEKNLKRIVKEAPGTAIAAEAQKELDQLAKQH